MLVAGRPAGSSLTREELATETVQVGEKKANKAKLFVILRRNKDFDEKVKQRPPPPPPKRKAAPKAQAPEHEKT
jgi:hypothetical protein